ncbi:O-antigen ligase domain-containing protein [Shewanella gelidii]|uniref:O-antigen ligase domain-containing protein n=1 Tax=Shewanella gelidii TaxID=1642821 RepID=A0A917N5H1_9GAMM|nr:O-antigen ligase domain-containing protein [Shewanella gelidii]MCL1096404.1 O-antigen ligase domain-containing protein [Shewanella gelidii]GGI67201.1 hypothetical protein GCM10009332_00320 [Shewanella gelidii]
MDTQTYTPQNFDERIVWYAITWTYGFWLIGAMYVVAPVIAWILFARVMWRLIHQQIVVTFAHWCWIIAMLVMLLALVVGHLDFELGAAKLIKSTIGWAKGWALLAIFPVIGCLDIRPTLIYRACTTVAKHTLILLPIFVMAWMLKLPATLYVSPLSIIGGPGPEFFSVSLYEIDPGSGTPRWRLFTPWAPALGMLANLYLIFSLQETSKRYRLYGIWGSLLMVLISQSRLGLVCYMALIGYFTFIRYAHRPWVYFAMTPAALFAGLVGIQINEKIEQTITAFKAARAGSTRVRQALADIAIQRWQNEAITWGHGIVERGPHLVEYMPIGSHHTWYGLLFVKGAVGAAALAVPMLMSLLLLLRYLLRSKLAATGVAIMLLLFLYTFGENLEILAYLFWPGLIILGSAHQHVNGPQGMSKPTRTEARTSDSLALVQE